MIKPDKNGCRGVIMSFKQNYLTDLLDDVAIGILILDQNSDIVMCNDFLLRLFNVKFCNYEGMKFGNVFKCINVLENGELCGTTNKCNICSLRNGVLFVLENNMKVADINVDHNFYDGSRYITKKFKISSRPIIHDGGNYVLVTFSDITDEIKYNLLFDNMTQGFALHEIILNESGEPVNYRFLDLNDGFEKMTGLNKLDILNKTVLDILPDTEQYWIAAYGKVAMTGESCKFENYSKVLNKYFDVWVYSPKHGQFVTIVDDITDRKSLEKELIEKELKLRSYFEKAPESVFVVDGRGKFLNVNLAMEVMTGYSKEELLCMDLMDIIPLDNLNMMGVKFKELRKKKKVDIQLPYMTNRNKLRFLNINAVQTDKNEYLCLAKDMTEKYEYELKIKHEYYHDNMTGLYNRQYVYDNLKEIENIANLPISYILADINGLRSINESFGYLVGDEIIKIISKTITKNCGKGTAARWSGDDFLIILPKSDEVEAQKFVQDFKKVLYDRLPVELKDVSICTGSFTKHTDYISFDEALIQADKYLLKNKATNSRSIQNSPINMILQTLHLKNEREERHSQRVSNICEKIGEAMNFSMEEVNKLKIIGLIHDIGKIGIDEKILNKEGKLTALEMVSIKQHPEIGFRILSANKNTTELAFYVLSHHEHLDGSGYPNGIKGKDIPFYSRILSIADAFDAMTRPRTYCDVKTKGEAIEELVRCSGTQFDGEIVEIFINKVLAINDFSVIEPTLLNEIGL